MSLQNIGALSQASCRFYRFAMQQVDDYNIRRIFQQRFDIYQQLLNLVVLKGAQPEVVENPQVKAAVDWFDAAQSSIQRFDNLIFLDLLEVQEGVALATLKKSVKSTETQELSAQLAQFAASLQVNRDDLAALKTQYRHQQGAFASFQS